MFTIALRLILRNVCAQVNLKLILCLLLSFLTGCQTAKYKTYTLSQGTQIRAKCWPSEFAVEKTDFYIVRCDLKSFGQKLMKTSYPQIYLEGASEQLNYEQVSEVVNQLKSKERTENIAIGIFAVIFIVALVAIIANAEPPKIKPIKVKPLATVRVSAPTARTVARTADLAADVLGAVARHHYYHEHYHHHHYERTTVVPDFEEYTIDREEDTHPAVIPYDKAPKVEFGKNVESTVVYGFRAITGKFSDIKQAKLCFFDNGTECHVVDLIHKEPT